MFRHSKKTHRLTWLIIVIIILPFYLNWQYRFFLTNPVDPDDINTINFYIKPNQKPRQIANELKKLDLIRSELAFYYYLKNSGLATKIKAGTFSLSKSQNIRQIAETLAQNSSSEISFLIPEGYDVKDIDQKLTDYELIQNGEFIKLSHSYPSPKGYPFLPKSGNLEGYLFPDTYFINHDSFQLEEFVTRLLNNFGKKALPELQKNNSARSLSDIIIMASLIEKEVRTDADRSIVAGILWKRLDSGWYLGVDATTVYYTDSQNLSAADLEADHPYNTRTRKGLPPTPISNPGLKAIQAALNPKESPYWYYLTPQGREQVIYSITNEEHNRNKQKYL